jgi:hypothetical protein
MKDIRGCPVCGERQRALWSPEIVPGQDIGVTGQGFFGMDQ